MNPNITHTLHTLIMLFDIFKKQMQSNYISGTSSDTKEKSLPELSVFVFLYETPARKCDIQENKNLIKKA